MDVGCRVARCLLVWVAATVVALVVAGWAWRAAVPVDLLAGGVDESLVGVCSWALVGCACWAWLATTAVILEALRGADRTVGGAGRLVPGALRRAILLACGTAVLATSVGTAAHADRPATGPAPAAGAVSLQPVRHDDPAPHRFRGLPLPDRQTGPDSPAGSSSPRAPTTPTVRVQPGDSLWRLAERRLGPGADLADVAAETWATYALNRDVVGPDPDLIHPGQQLRSPAPTSSTDD